MTTKDAPVFEEHRIKVSDFFRKFADILDKRVDSQAQITERATKRIADLCREAKSIAFSELEVPDDELKALRGEVV